MKITPQEFVLFRWKAVRAHALFPDQEQAAGVRLRARFSTNRRHTRITVPEGIVEAMQLILQSLGDGVIGLQVPLVPHFGRMMMSCEVGSTRTSGQSVFKGMELLGSVACRFCLSARHPLALRRDLLFQRLQLRGATQSSFDPKPSEISAAQTPQSVCLSTKSAILAGGLPFGVSCELLWFSCFFVICFFLKNKNC